MASNFDLETTTFLDGGSMDESGKRTITKHFIYTIRNNTEENRRKAVLDLTSLVPRKGSCMSDDPRYVMKSAKWNCYDWNKQSVKFYIDAVYQRAFDDTAEYPWKLPPFNVSFGTVEEAIAFKMAYNRSGEGEKDEADNKLNVPVLNSAGDPIDANTNDIFPEFSFSYYDKDFDAASVYEFQSTVNDYAQELFGHTFPKGTLLMSSLSAEGLVTYQDDGVTEKWRYTQVNMTIRYNPNGWGRRLLDVGNRAIFGESTKSELIYQYYAPIYGATDVEFETTPTLTNAQGYYTANRTYRAWLAEHDDATGCPAQLPYEYAESIPLNPDGTINTDALDGTEPYPEIEFQEYRFKNWRQLGIPREVLQRWR